MKGKPVSESRTTMTEVVLPNDANIHGNILGGKVMHLMDLAGVISAFRHCRMPVVTVSVDSLCFLHPIKVGQLVLLEAVVTRAFTTSMEVEVQVFSEDPLSGKRMKTSAAFLTFVGLDMNGKPTRVPPLIPRTQEDKRRYRAALRRRRQRLSEARAVGTKDV
ncbi:acyl-CoA thioesterase [Acidobacteria bacterium AH-259-O06]|nr:acyl-CoA thioesterase [Acidobacteria bacterium AH-259-O06]